MSILIKGMEMPTCCAGCCLDRFCKHWDIVPYRHEDCPLVLVPPHGRLIDADALMERFWDGQCYFTDAIKSKLYTMCSACGYGYSNSHYHEVEEFKFCPNCGADMREES